MCIVSGEVEDISATKIFVAKLENEQQVTIYDNKIIIKQQNILDPSNRWVLPPGNNNVAMILPYPKGEIEIFDMKGVNDIFKPLNKLFTKHQKGSRGSYSLMTTNAYTDNDAIEVKKVGSYDTSIVPSYEDFSRLQFDKFQLDQGITKLLEDHYKYDYGFLVCIIRSGANYHPIAYSHKLNNNEFFIPTKHYHNGSDKNPDWDHSIYTLDSKMNDYYSSSYQVNTKTINPEILGKLPMPLALLQSNNVPINRININKSYHENHDILVPCN